MSITEFGSTPVHIEATRYVSLEQVVTALSGETTDLGDIQLDKR